MGQSLTDTAGRDTLARAGWLLATPSFARDPHPSVPGLFGSSRPSAVARFVMPVVVDSIKRKSWRAATHVCQERAEIVSPAFADGDSTGAVILVGGILRIRAASFHVAPARILGGIGGSVSDAFETHARTSETSARDSLAGAEAHLSDVFDGSTGATASPRSEWFRPRMRQGKNGQATVCLSGQVERHSATIAQMCALA